MNIGHSPTLAPTIACTTFGVTQLTYLLIERPSHNLGRRLSGRRKGRHAKS